MFILISHIHISYIYLHYKYSFVCFLFVCFFLIRANEFMRLIVAKCNKTRDNEAEIYLIHFDDTVYLSNEPETGGEAN